MTILIIFGVKNLPYNLHSLMLVLLQDVLKTDIEPVDVFFCGIKIRG